MRVIDDQPYLINNGSTKAAHQKIILAWREARRAGARGMAFVEIIAGLAHGIYGAVAGGVHCSRWRYLIMRRYVFGISLMSR